MGRKDVLDEDGMGYERRGIQMKDNIPSEIAGESWASGFKDLRESGPVTTKSNVDRERLSCTLVSQPVVRIRNSRPRYLSTLHAVLG